MAHMTPGLYVPGLPYAFGPSEDVNTRVISISVESSHALSLVIKLSRVWWHCGHSRTAAFLLSSGCKFFTIVVCLTPALVAYEAQLQKLSLENEETVRFWSPY